jgi:hypothetical protein
MEEGRTQAHQPFPASAGEGLSWEAEAASPGNPELAANVLVAGFQALWWLFGRPSAWRSFLAGRQPSLPANFTVADLHRTTLADRGTRRLLTGLCVSWCILLLLTSTLVSVAIGRSVAQISFAVLYGFILSFAGTVMISSLLSVAAGATGGLAIGTVFTLACAVALRRAHSVAALAFAFNRSSQIATIAGGIPAVVAVGAATGVAISIGIGMAGAMTAEFADSAPLTRPTRQVGGVVIGVVLSGLIDALLLEALFIAQSLADANAFRITFGLLVAALVFAVGVLQRRTAKWRVGTATAFGATAGASILFAAHVPLNSYSNLILSGVCTALMYSSLFALAFAAGTRISDSSAGAVASALGSGLPLVLFLSFGTHTTAFWPAAPMSFVCICAGLLLPRYGYAAAYLLEMPWNMILYRADQRRDKGNLLLRNAAFWDDRQRLPLFGLDDHLLLALERNPEATMKALTWLGRGPQAWATQAARIERYARTLDECSTLEKIGDMHRALPMFEDSDPGDPVQYFRNISRDVHAALQFESPYQRHALLRTIHARMNDLLLQGLPSMHGERLRPILARWNQIAGEMTDFLSEMARECGEIENPYVIGVPLTAEQHVFVGRSEVSARLAQALLSSQAQPLLLYGQRRMGKTSLLNNLGQLLPGQIVPFFVDLQGPASYASDSSGFLAALSRAMVTSAKRFRGIQLSPLPSEALVTSPFMVFDEWLDSVEQVLQDRVLLLALDEFEALEVSLWKHRLDEAALLGMLRHLTQHRQRFRLVLAASHSASEMSRLASYLINLQVVKIGYLTEAEIRQLVEHPLRNFALKYEPSAVQRVIELTSGHPHLLQSLCYEIVSLKNEQSTDLRYQANHCTQAHL